MSRVLVPCLLFSLIVSSLVVADPATQSVPEADPSQKQAASGSREELILGQLEALRNELKALRAEVGQLSKAVGDIHRVAVRPKAPPAPAKISFDDDAVLGNPEAKVAIVEFSDFQCPYCSRFHNITFPQLRENYIDTGKVRYVYRDFPLKQIHPKATQAAVAANCSGQQGKYWEMHHSLFTNQGRLGPELYNELAEGFQLDLAAFQACLEDPEQNQEVNNDLAYGQSVGVRGTPHYFVGRVEGDQIVDVKRLNGAQPFQSFAKIIDTMLQ